jgi:hypothetical protein
MTSNRGEWFLSTIALSLVPTTTDLSLATAAPATQRVLVDRVQKHCNAIFNAQ